MSVEAFAVEAVERYRELAELAYSLGLTETSALLRERIAWLDGAISGDNAVDDLPGFLFEAEYACALKEVLLDLRTRVDECLKKWPFDSPHLLQAGIAEIKAVVSRLARLGEIKASHSSLSGRRSERWGVEPPKVQDPPMFLPGKKKRPC